MSIHFLKLFLNSYILMHVKAVPEMNFQSITDKEMIRRMGKVKFNNYNQVGFSYLTFHWFFIVRLQLCQEGENEDGQ